VAPQSDDEEGGKEQKPELRKDEPHLPKSDLERDPYKEEEERDPEKEPARFSSARSAGEFIALRRRHS
jgi:hypothetical protein